MSDCICPVCAKPFVQDRLNGKPRKYCAKDCYYEAAKRRSRLQSAARPRKPSVPCAVCATPTRPHGVNTYCSDADCVRERNRRLSAANIRPICQFCNRSKKDCWPFCPPIKSP